MGENLESCNIERRSGVDALRVLAMLGVVWLHVNSQVAFGENYDSYFGWMSWIDGFTHSFAILSVNCFALASGYLLSGSKMKSGRLLSLWLQVIVWSALSGLAAACVFGKSFSQYSRLDRYWYVNAYTCVLLLLPALNALVRVWNENVRGGLAIVLTICLVGHFSGHDMFSLKHGYSAFWLLCLYCVGGIIRLHEHQIRRLPSIALLASITVACGAICGVVALALVKPKSFIVGHSLWNLVNTYTSPLIVTGATLAFCAALRIRCATSRVLLFLSRHCFAVYLIHMSCLGVEGLTYLHANLRFPASRMLMALWEILIAIGIFAVCVGLDTLRTIVFSKFGINQFIELIGRRIDRLFSVSSDEVMRLNNK